VPWQGRVIVGTTDTRRKGPELEPRALAEERSFVLEHARRYLGKDPTEKDVLSIFTGLRPLVRQNGTGGTAGWSRDHTIVVSESGLVSVTGGKWTTYRQMAEDVMDRAEQVAQIPHRPSPTRELRLHGWTAASGPDGHWDAYGAQAGAVKAICAERPAWSAPLHPRLPWLAGEVIWQVRFELARTVDDVVARRMRALLWDAGAAIEMAPRVATLLAGELGRDESWQRSQVDTFGAMARRYVFTDPASVESDLQEWPGPQATRSGGRRSGRAGRP
jgi:glycerol-3-phosphate dehydrogenase